MKRQVTHQIKIGEKIYPIGIHDFSEAEMAEPHYKHFVNAGRILTPKGEAAKDALKTEAALAQRREMEARYGIPQKAKAAPSSADVKVDGYDDKGFEPKIEVEEKEEAQTQAHKKSKR